MSGYHVEHGIKDPSNPPNPEPRRRPDLSTFFSTLDTVDTSGSRRPRNAHSLPLPQDIAAAYRTLANAFEMMRGAAGGVDVGDRGGGGGGDNSELLATLVQSLMESADHPPTQVEGVPDEFIEKLERVAKKTLEKNKDDACPICGNPFLEDKHPLVVRLPCKGEHIFDLECIVPWLKLNPTCPMDRQALIKKKEPPEKDEEEEEWDDMYS